MTTQALAQDERILRLVALLTSADVAAFNNARYRGWGIPVQRG
ncbi:hypothetical protein [Methylobacterium sp.]